ncbi:MAG TPA: hypothetical protein QF564_18015 [Pirellulaceae bacterium]|nr:hypothetical protein [Pirellulaceae bacterium]
MDDREFLHDRIADDFRYPQFIDLAFEVTGFDIEGQVLRVDPSAHDKRCDDVFDVVDDDSRRTGIEQCDPGDQLPIEEEGIQLILVAELPRHVVPLVVGNVLPLFLVGPTSWEKEITGAKILR